jgi:hypothetical protein
MGNAMSHRKPEEAVSARVRLRSFNGTTQGPSERKQDENYWLLIGMEGVVVAPKNERNRLLVRFLESIASLGLQSHNPIPNTLFILESDLEFLS